MSSKGRILVAALNWGLGHATRLVPVIRALIDTGHEPILASDGAALDWLRKEFPDCISVSLPSYTIRYARNRHALRLNLIRQFPRIIKVLREENRQIEALIESHNIQGIISDNRFGVHSQRVPSVYITHQLCVMSGWTTPLSSYWHRRVIRNFNQCWIPDLEAGGGISGKLGHAEKMAVPIKYIGPLSRFRRDEASKLYDLAMLLSGPEPQRSILEDKLIAQFRNFEGAVVLIRGVVESAQQKTSDGNLTIYNYMLSQELEQVLNRSAVVLSRSGYSTIMDLAALGRPAFFIPTPGQFEQEYLARRMDEQGVVPSCSQNRFKADMLSRVSTYSGLRAFGEAPNFEALFSLFEGK